jgi:hypothetical protein
METDEVPDKDVWHLIRCLCAIIVGVCVILFGCRTQLVGHSYLHGWLVFIGAVMIIDGGWSLT